MIDDKPLSAYDSSIDTKLTAGRPAFDDKPLSAYDSSLPQDTSRSTEDTSVGTGIHGIPAAPATWGDVGHYLSAGIHGVEATGAGFLASTAGGSEAEQAWRKTAREQQEAAQEDIEQTTPTAQPGWRHPVLWAAEQAPGLVAMAAPTAAATAVGGPGAGAVVLGSVMAAQTRGDMYNRLTSEGIEPTSGQLLGATALGAASGLAMEVTGGLSKTITSPLVSRALGIGGDAVIFGGTSALQEQTGQAAEIAAGQRDRYDTGEIGSQVLTGIETGAGFGVAHLLRGKEKPPGAETRLPQGGVSAEPSRSGKADARKPEAQGAGRVADQPATGPPPPPPKVDIDQAAALKPDALGSSVTLGVDQPKPPVEQPGVAQPTGPPAGTASEAPGTADTTAPPPPPPPTTAPQPAAQPAPSPPPVPESEATLREQQAALLDPTNAREAMVYPPGVKPFDITTNRWRYGTTKLADGRYVQYDTRGPNSLTRAKIKELDKNDKLNELLQLGPVSQAEAVKQSVAGAEPAVVTERAPPTTPGEPGVERKAAEGTTATAPAQAEALEATKTPDSTVQVETHEETIGDRFKKARDEAIARQGEQAAPTGEGSLGKMMLTQADKKALRDLGHSDEAISHMTPDQGADIIARGERATPRVGDTLEEQLRAHEAEKATQAKATEDALATERATRAEALKREMNEKLAAEAPRRILRSETEEERQAAARQTEADRIAAEKVAAEKPAPPPKPKEEQQERKVGDEKKQELLRINDVAREVVNAPEHLPKDDETVAAASEGREVPGARKRILERAQAMVKAAIDKGYKFMRPLRDRVGETNHPNEGVLLHEAQLLARKKVLKVADVRRFMYAENELRNNGEAGRKAVMDMRSQTGRDWAAAGAAPTVETAHEGLEGGEAIKPTKEGVSHGAVEKPDVAEEMEKAKERVEEEEVAKEPGEERKETPLQKQAREASERARAKLEAQERGERERPTPRVEGEEEPAVRGFQPRAAASFTVEKRGKWSKLEEHAEEEPTSAREKPGTDVTFGSGDNKVTVRSLRPPETAEEAVAKSFQLGRYPAFTMRLMSKLRDLVVKIAGDTPVHYVSGKDMAKLVGHKDALGGYNSIALNGRPVIIINADRFRGDTALHETFHAAVDIAIAKNPDLKALMERLRIEAVKNMGDLTDAEYNEISYFFSNHKEFLNGMMTNWRMQELLKGVKISAELAKDIGISKWRRMTSWEGALAIIRDALGLEPRDVSAIEAAMSLTEQAVWRDPRGVGELMQASGRLAESQMKGEGWSLQRAPEQQVQARAKDAQDATNKPYEFWKSEFARAKASGTMEKAYHLWTKASNSDTLRIASEHLFGRRDEGNSFRRAQEGMLKQEQLIRNMLGEHDPLVQRLADMKRTNPNGLDRLITLLSESADFNVHPDESMGMGRNSHINPKQFDETAAAEHQEAFLAHPRLSSEYEGSTKEEQSLFRDLRDSLMTEGRKSAQASYDSFADGLKRNFEKDDKLQAALAKPENARSPAELKQVERYNAISKVLEGDKLEGEEKDKYNADPQIEMLRRYKSMQKQEGPHFPGTRKGDWVVNAEHELPKAPNALSMEGNEVTFATKKEAFDYRQELVDRSLPSQLETIKEPISSEQGRGQGADTYKVTVQNKHSSAVNSKYEGAKLAAVLKEQGLKNVTNPMLREKNENIDYGLHSGTIRAMDHAVDALTHLSKEQKQTLKDANEQAALGLMRGHRLNLGLMRRNRVRGANADPVLAVHDYFSASARNRARAKTMPDIDRAFDEMRNTARNVQDDDTWKRGMLVNEMEQRVLNFGKEGFTGQMPNWLQHLSTLAYLKYMMAPVHYALDLTHPDLITIPQLAGRHGYVNARMAFHKALGDLGGRTPAMVKGLSGAWKAAWERGHAPTDFSSFLMNTFKESGATAQEISAVERAMETGALHSILMDFRPHLDKTSKFDVTLQRMQGVGQEMSSAVDAINRFSSFVASYRLERQKMGKATTMAESAAHHAQAVRYAKDMVTQTQGLYTASNRASMLKNPAVRAAMQFRSVPMMIYKILARNVYNIAKPETPEMRWAAVRSLLSTMGTSAALVGAAGGTPEPIRLAIMLTHMLGLTGSWQDLEDKARREADTELGKFGGRLVMDGVLGAAGLSAGSRIGLNDLMFSSQAMASPKDFMFELFVGASGGYLNDEMGGIGKLMSGDFAKGIPALMPIRLLSDISKAYVENQEGKPGKGVVPGMQPLDPFETFIKGIGGQPTREATYGKMLGLIKEESAYKKAATQSGLPAMRTWNASHPHNKINVAQALKAKQANKPESAKTKQLREDYRAYQ